MSALEVVCACGCIATQPREKPSVFWRVSVPCSEHEVGDTFVDDLKLSALNRAKEAAL
jgi:hypothetical protein